MKRREQALLFLRKAALGLLGLDRAGFFPASRPFGFGAITLFWVLRGVYVTRVYPNHWVSLSELSGVLPSTLFGMFGLPR